MGIACVGLLAFHVVISHSHFGIQHWCRPARMWVRVPGNGLAMRPTPRFQLAFFHRIWSDARLGLLVKSDVTHITDIALLSAESYKRLYSQPHGRSDHRALPHRRKDRRGRHGRSLSRPRRTPGSRRRHQSPSGRSAQRRIRSQTFPQGSSDSSRSSTTPTSPPSMTSTGSRAWTYW